jgi:predicted nuclease of predicted toxin-antitoxin system
MAKLYSNENFPWPAVLELRQLGHDVLTIQETGQADQAMPDEAVLAYATTQQRILLTFNRKHFIRLHHQQPDHAGIMVCSLDVDFARLAQRIHQAITNATDFKGQLIRINRPNV